MSKSALKTSIKFAVILLFISAFSNLVLAQNGTVAGKIVDTATGEELIGATVLVEGTSKGTVTDISGNYQLDLEPGNYRLVYSYVSYASKTVEGVEVKAGEVNRLDITLQSEDVQLEEIVVQAEQVNNNEVALLKLQQKSLAVQDGISIGEIRRIGATNSAESMKNITGASVEGGKYVVLRGLGDRYSLTQVNGIIMPSTDPYRNSASLDLIPSSMVENIVTTKTFTPDQPGNFTGGNVDVSTRSIPDQFYLSAGISVGYNTAASFQKDFLVDPISSSLDWLGYDNGAHELPAFLRNEENRQVLSNNSIINNARSGSEAPENVEARRALQGGVDALYNRSFLPVTSQSLMNHRFQFALGDRKTVFGNNFGYNLSLNYSRNQRHYNNRLLNIWEFPADPNSASLQENLNTAGIQSVDNPTLGGIASIAYQLNNRNELAFDYTFNNDVERTAASLEGIWPGAISGNHTFFSRNISYLQRTINSLQLRGKHSLGANNARLNWVLGYTNSMQDEPDVRVFANQLTVRGYSIDNAEYDRPFHFFRNLEDRQYSGKIDLELPFGTDAKHQFKTGLYANRKSRDFRELRFQHEESRLRSGEYLTFREADGDLDAYFSRDNYGILGQSPMGTYQIAPYFIDQTRPSNIYAGEEQVLAAYAMGVIKATEQLKLVGGVRAEKTNFEVQTENPNDPVGKIDVLDFLPSLNAIYALNDRSNLRLSGSRTIARPNMREIAPFSSFDFIGGFIYVGNPALNRSTIWNADLRYEFFSKPGELFAVSGFYKHFNDPIQQRLEPVASGGQISYVNVDQGQLYGLEFEYRKSLDFIGGAFFEKLKFATNFTYTLSKVDLTEEELVIRRNVNPDIKSWRPFQAQSPYIANVNLSYYDPERELEATVYMNVYGRRLFANGFGGSPDVYEINGNGNVPTPDLRFTISKKVFDNLRLGFRAENILGYDIERNLDFRGNYFIQERFSPGRTFTVSLGYSLE